MDVLCIDWAQWRGSLQCAATECKYISILIRSNRAQVRDNFHHYYYYYLIYGDDDNDDSDNLGIYIPQWHDIDYIYVYNIRHISSFPLKPR